MSSASTSVGKEEAGSKLETFTGENAGDYRRWRRRAMLYLQALPTTIPEKKWGARILENLSGEAEELMESLMIEDIIKEDGYKKVFKILDEKYKEPEKDELQRVLKEYLYTIGIKEGETYRNFMIRLDTSYKALVRNGVELPDTVRGWLLLKKLSLDQTSEAMIMTSSNGSVVLDDVVRAVRNVFPNGKSSKTIRTKDIFVADEDHGEKGMQSEGEKEEDMEPYEVMEAVASQIQGHDDYESEDALDAFEAYASVRRKIQEKKTTRGYRTSTPAAWQLTGTVRGKIEALKSKTKCHLCKRVGHWKRECPLKNKGSKSEKSSAASSSNASAKEAYVVDIVGEAENFHEIYQAEVRDEKPSQKKVQDSWIYDLENDMVIRKHEKPRKGLFTPHGVAGLTIDIGEFSGERKSIINYVNGKSELVTDNFHTSKVPHQKMNGLWTGETQLSLKNRAADIDKGKRPTTIEEYDVMIATYEEEVLSALGSDQSVKGAQPKFSTPHFEVHESQTGLDFAALDEHAVPDTACRKTLIGDYTLRGLECKLGRRGLKVIMLFQCSSLVRVLECTVNGIRPIAMPKSPLAKALINELREAEGNQEVTYVGTQIDQVMDLSEDEGDCPISGEELIQAGKYKGKKTMSEVYVEDKLYINWVRQHINKTSTKEMIRLRLYVECRDENKADRMKEAKKSQMSQMPKTPMRAAKAKMGVKKNHLREGDGWGEPESQFSMDMEDWELEQEEIQETMSPQEMKAAADNFEKMARMLRREHARSSD
eukprot:s11_g71.t1